MLIPTFAVLPRLPAPTRLIEQRACKVIPFGGAADQR
jgi:hypothetical protein